MQMLQVPIVDTFHKISTYFLLLLLTDAQGWKSPLMVAAASSSPDALDIVKALLNADADPLAKDLVG